MAMPARKYRAAIDLGHAPPAPSGGAEEPDSLAADARRFEARGGRIPNAITDDELRRKVAAITRNNFV